MSAESPVAALRSWHDGGTVTSTSPLSGGTWASGDIIAGLGAYLAL